jgi:hypothetical protein
VWVVVYEHKHGVDAWPTATKPTIEQVKEQMRAEGSWDDDDEDDERNNIEIRGPWTFKHGDWFV